MSIATASRRSHRPEEPGLLEDAERRRREAAELISNQYAACRVQFTWLGTRKSLSKDQKATAAAQFDADATYLGASKKLLDTKDESWKAVTGIKTRIRDVWENLTLPYIEPGVRLIRLEHVEAFDRLMRDLQAELREAVAGLQGRYAGIKAEARERLGSLFNPGDYADDLQSSFAVAWDFPALDPPTYLSFLSPELYERAQRQFAARMEETVTLAEAAFVEQFRELVAHLVERLTGDDDGKPKVFRDSAVDGLKDFFERFKTLNLRSNPDLDALVDKAKQVVGTRDASELKDSGRIRAEVAGGLAAVKLELDGLIVSRPRRRVVLPGQDADFGMGA